MAVSKLERQLRLDVEHHKLTVLPEGETIRTIRRINDKSELHCITVLFTGKISLQPALIAHLAYSLKEPKSLSHSFTQTVCLIFNKGTSESLISF